MITIHDLKKPLRKLPSQYRIRTRVTGYVGSVHWQLTMWHAGGTGQNPVYVAQMSHGSEYEITGDQFTQSAVNLIA